VTCKSIFSERNRFLSAGFGHGDKSCVLPKVSISWKQTKLCNY